MLFMKYYDVCTYFTKKMSASGVGEREREIKRGRGIKITKIHLSVKNIGEK